MLSAVDSEEKLRQFLPIVEKMVEEGLVALSDVEIIKYSHRPLEIDPTEAGATTNEGVRG